MAFSVSQRSCLPSHQVHISDRVQFWQEVQVQTTYTSQDLRGNVQSQLSSLRSCPPNVQKNYPYPFHAGHYVRCQYGALEIICCPTGQLYSLSQRQCVPRSLLSAHDYLDYSYISAELSSKHLKESWWLGLDFRPLFRLQLSLWWIVRRFLVLHKHRDSICIPSIAPSMSGAGISRPSLRVV